MKMNEWEISGEMSDKAWEVMAMLMEKNAQETSQVTEWVIDNNERKIKRLEAELAAIRDQITVMMTGYFMPHPQRVLAALYPEDAVIDNYLKDNDDEARN